MSTTKAELKAPLAMAADPSSSGMKIALASICICMHTTISVFAASRLASRMSAHQAGVRLDPLLNSAHTQKMADRCTVRGVRQTDHLCASNRCIFP
ncbi:hypothetical protein DUNSADRAFT_16625 [Dunaliella salina]|uniref:Encoded protein n=1 Tax=Dunaliella salina TaxID=3046 RepID=A0ABQ7G386_DUNSA|nr:hypothetical protein DUNSADRAFT_16625 [Dunaliella salina]|eukprot:KAF5829068.1 hypothetical protein DUNSADRAFT_16625 [Dunaliella salina]